MKQAVHKPKSKAKAQQVYIPPATHTIGAVKQVTLGSSSYHSPDARHKYT